MAMTLSTLDTMVQRSETAIIRQLRIQERQQKLAKLTTELKRRRTKLHSLAQDIGLASPDRIYKILDGTRPTPENFIDDVCTWTGIPLYKVLPDDEYHARSSAERDEMHLANMDWMA